MARGTIALLWRMLLLSLLLGGCSVMGSLHFGDLTLGLQDGFAGIGSHVGLFVH